jgi:hypothetical protein
MAFIRYYLLTFRQTTLSGYFDSSDLTYVDFKHRFEGAARLLSSSDRDQRTEGVNMIVSLVEDGVGVLEMDPRTEWQGRPYYNIERPLTLRLSKMTQPEFG